MASLPSTAAAAAVPAKKRLHTVNDSTSTDMFTGQMHAQY